MHYRPKNNYSKFQGNFEKKVFDPIIHGGKKDYRHLRKAAAKS